ncbi:MAG: adenylate/guanylate cyclase domain-containing protein [Planctomycetes bacterium]|nr:adenylate/guanylate cyclase domain-containing protein [Planctomycetota bacterium]
MLSHVLLPVSHCVTYPAMQERLNKLLAERASPGSDSAAIDSRIWELYGETWAVMFTDLAGFSRQVASFGVTHFLQVIYESFRVYVPVIEAHNGVLLKVEGDSMMVLFRKPAAALECAIAMQRAGAAYNKNRADDEKLLLSIGLGYGEVLKFGDQDVYGSEVNVACKLGEDLGTHHSVLASDSFHEAVKGATPLRLVKHGKTPAGTVQAWMVEYDSK